MAKKFVLSIGILIAFVLFAGGVRAIYYTNKNKERRNDIDKLQIEKGDFIPEDEVNNRGKNNTNKPVNIVLLGLDKDRTRSDVILLANYKPGQKKINLLSITRDTRVIVNDKSMKLNALVGMGGEDLAIAEIEKLTGIPIEYYVTMDFNGFRKIIDELGGVEIEVPFDMNYDDPSQDLHIHLKKGKQTLDGDKAEQFVRYRQDNVKNQGYKNGDLGRISAQQMFVRELFKQKFNLKYISKIDEIYAILKDHTKTNVQLLDIMHYLKDFNIKIDEIKSWTIPGDIKVIDDVSYYIHDSKKTFELIENNFYK